MGLLLLLINLILYRVAPLVLLKPGRATMACFLARTLTVPALLLRVHPAQSLELPSHMGHLVSFILLPLFSAAAHAAVKFEPATTEMPTAPTRTCNAVWLDALVLAPMVLGFQINKAKPIVLLHKLVAD
jgi:hypothetical protein